VFNADDVIVIIRDSNVIKVVLENLEVHHQALWCGSERLNVPQLPNNVIWRKDGFKFLGVFLGCETQEKELGGVVGKSVYPAI